MRLLLHVGAVCFVGKNEQSELQCADGDMRFAVRQMVRLREFMPYPLHATCALVFLLPADAAIEVRRVAGIDVTLDCF